jgi:hypothetical protein
LPTPTNNLAYGLHDLQGKPISAAGVLGALVDFPGSQEFAFTEAEDFETLRGDDGVLAIRGKGAMVDFDFSTGGVPLEAWSMISGATLTTTGVSPSQVKKLAKTGNSVRPYFKIEGQALSDSGGDVHGVVYRCRCNKDIKGTMADGAFWITSAGGMGIPDANNGQALYDLIWNETVALIT